MNTRGARGEQLAVRQQRATSHMRASPPSYTSLEDGAADAVDAAHDSSPTAREPSLHHEPHVLRLRQGYGLWREQQVRRTLCALLDVAYGASCYAGRCTRLGPSRMDPSASARLPLSRRGVFVNAWTVTTALFSTLAAPYSHATHQGVCAVAQNRLGFTEHPPAEFRRIKPLGTGTVHGLSLNGSGVSACLGVQPPDKQSLGRMVNQPTTTVQRDWTV